MQARFLSAFLLAALFSLSSLAAPFLDEELKAWLSSGSAAPRNVLIRLDVQPPARQLAPGAARTAEGHAKLLRGLQSPVTEAIGNLAAELGMAGHNISERLKPLWVAQAAALVATPAQVKALLKSRRVKAVYADRRIRLAEPRAEAPPPPQGGYAYGLVRIGVPALRTRYPGLDGRGVVVGLLDSGVDATHPDLEGKVAAFRDFVGTQARAYDDHGHGTHVSGTIAGGNGSGTWIGVAPGARLVVAKAFDSGGNAFYAALIAGMQWMADPDGNPATVNDVPRVVNNSWGVFDNREDSPLFAAVRSWRVLGILPCFAAGNSGPISGSMEAPGVYPTAFAAAATDERDLVAEFSSRGPGILRRTEGVQTVEKPDIAAPGVAVLSALPGGRYDSWSGTSMATPHVTGVAALLFQAVPEIADQGAAELMARYSDDLGTPGFDYAFGHGRLNALRAIRAARLSGYRAGR